MPDNNPAEGAEDFEGQENTLDNDSQPEEGNAPAKDAQKEESFTDTYDVNAERDLSEIPEEYRPLLEEEYKKVDNSYKSMQADYTRKNEGRSELQRKADAFDEVAPYLEEKQNADAKQEDNTKPDEEELSPEQKEAKDYFQKMIDKTMEEKLNPLEQDRQDREVDSYFDDLTDKYPDFKESAPEVLTEYEKTGENPELIYLRMTLPKEHQRGINESEKNRQKRAADTVERGAAGVSNVSNKQAQNVKEAWAQAEADG